MTNYKQPKPLNASQIAEQRLSSGYPIILAIVHYPSAKWKFYIIKDSKQARKRLSVLRRNWSIIRCTESLPNPSAPQGMVILYTHRVLHQDVAALSSMP